MDKETLVFAAHGVVAIGLLTFGIYRISLGQVVPGTLNVAMSVAIVGVGFYVQRLA
jgi:uncharacterized membrane protein YiaA